MGLDGLQLVVTLLVPLEAASPREVCEVGSFIQRVLVSGDDANLMGRCVIQRAGVARVASVRPRPELLEGVALRKEPVVVAAGLRQRLRPRLTGPGAD